MTFEETIFDYDYSPFVFNDNSAFLVGFESL